MMCVCHDCNCLVVAHCLAPNVHACCLCVCVVQIVNKGLLEIIGIEIGKGLDLPL